MTSVSDVMDYILDHAVVGSAPQTMADLYDQLVWILDDNGAGINEVRRQWLLGSDSRRVEIALLMGEVFPFKERSQMEHAFFGICEKWPQYAHLCHQILARWDEYSAIPPQQPNWVA